MNDDLQQRMAAYVRLKAEEYQRVMAGGSPPGCYICHAPATHVTDQIMPSGYHGYACDLHTPRKPAPLWGSDPGWQVHYKPIEEERKRWMSRDT